MKWQYSASDEMTSLTYMLAAIPLVVAVLALGAVCLAIDAGLPR